MTKNGKRTLAIVAALGVAAVAMHVYRSRLPGRSGADGEPDDVRAIDGRGERLTETVVRAAREVL